MVSIFKRVESDHYRLRFQSLNLHLTGSPTRKIATELSERRVKWLLHEVDIALSNRCIKSLSRHIASKGCRVKSPSREIPVASITAAGFYDRRVRRVD